ncbi:MAG: hypothetical protein EA398_07295 [Deltaproteobacteria bacterium]|nr:MAG: hypothetical protein EA398_07295 [Deltaproteobacteria bacterium]
MNHIGLDRRRFPGALPAVTLLLLFLVACGGDSPGTSSCESVADCASGQACLQVDELNVYDPLAPGLCIDTECTSDRECPAGEVCRGNACVLLQGGGGEPATETPPQEFCEEDEDCTTPGHRCVAGVCTGDAPPTTTGDPCDGVICESDQRCEAGACVPVGSSGPPLTGCDACTAEEVCIDEACYPAGSTQCGAAVCPPGQVCNNGVCQLDPGGGGGGDLCTGVSCPAGEICNRANGQCIPNTCELNESECPSNAPFVDIVACRCVGCAADSDCDEDETCTQLNRCLFAGRGSCSSQADCPGGTFCQAGRCVDCIAAEDCGQDLFCVRGACKPCECPEGEICSPSGVCVPDFTRGCSSDAECQSAAGMLGSPNPENGRCDPEVGCFMAGECNSGIGGNDPFNAPCAAGTVCQTGSDLGGILDIFLGGGGEPVSACGGCTEGAAPGQPGGCRQGEECRAGCADPLDFGCLIGGLLGGDDEPSCQTVSSGGGGGFPFPFP